MAPAAKMRAVAHFIVMIFTEYLISNPFQIRRKIAVMIDMVDDEKKKRTKRNRGVVVWDCRYRGTPRGRGRWGRVVSQLFELR